MKRAGLKCKPSKCEILRDSIKYLEEWFATRGAIYVAGRTPITVLHMGGRDLWMIFLVVENLDDADQLILGRDFFRNFDVMIDLNNGLIRIRNPDRKYVKNPINRIITDENKVPIFFR